MQTDIKCQQCGTLFGKQVSIQGEEKGNEILTIKNRDLYRSFRGGTVFGPCRGCGITVRWPSSDKD